MEKRNLKSLIRNHPDFSPIVNNVYWGKSVNHKPTKNNVPLESQYLARWLIWGINEEYYYTITKVALKCRDVF